MDLNNPNVTSDARHVVGRFLLNGIEVPFVSVDVDSNAFYSADTFSATLALSAMPPGMNLLSWWADQTSMTVQVSVGLINQSMTDWTTLIVGQVDKFSYMPGRFEIRLDGRDFTALLIDAKTSDKFSNQTTSQVATMLAKRHGLTPVVTPTKTSVGSIYKWDHTHVSSDSTEWDILSFFAGIDGFQCYVTGKELHYEPMMGPKPADVSAKKKELAALNKQRDGAAAKADALNAQAMDLVNKSKAARAAGNSAQADAYLQQATTLNQQAGQILTQAHADTDGAKASLEKQIAAGGDSSSQYVIRWSDPGVVPYPTANVSEDIAFERNLTLAKGVTVKVRSWHKGKVVEGIYPNSSPRGVTPGNATPKRQLYIVDREGLDHQAALALARQIHQQVTQHEMRLSCSMPGDNLLMPNTMVRVEGTASGFDQLYFVESVRRSLSFDSGYTMSLEAKNHNPNTQVSG
ncbi:hypothetical protein CBW21_21935 [Chromobacterium violaceum]|uniref:Phage protein D n=1 Tax=Chromobacterium violaceum TaxID=536 RepID=A0A202B2I0_CHRVL|nr:hypothetical protein CBW21_21935 [Chromobacterium violaceum]